MDRADQTTEFERLLHGSRGRLYAVARTFADSESEDLLQEILLQIWRSWPTFTGSSTFETWCYRIALNTAISWRRRASTRQHKLQIADVNPEQVPAKSPDFSAAETIHLFAQTLANSDKALLLMYLDDLSGDEMATMLGLASGTVRVRIHRLKQRLATWLGERHES